MSHEDKQIFICYAREDFDYAMRLFDDLERSGVSPWLDKENLLGGEKWELIIKHAITSSSYVLILLSERAITKRGFIHKEIKHALEVSEEFPESAIFIIPIRLEKCEPPSRLNVLQWVDLFPDYEAGFKRLLKVLAPEGQVNLLKRKLKMLAEILKQSEPKTDLKTILHLSSDPVELRSHPIRVSMEEAPQKFEVTGKFGPFAGEFGKPFKYIYNEYEEQGDIVFDHVTGLTWQKDGSDLLRYYTVSYNIYEYIEELNSAKFGGYTDWRLPTIPELLSLLEPERQLNNLYINPIFNSKQRWVWSNDAVGEWSGIAWIVAFNHGHMNSYRQDATSYVRCVR